MQSIQSIANTDYLSDLWRNVKGVDLTLPFFIPESGHRYVGMYYGEVSVNGKKKPLYYDPKSYEIRSEYLHRINLDVMSLMFNAAVDKGEIRSRKLYKIHPMKNGKFAIIVSKHKDNFSAYRMGVIPSHKNVYKWKCKHDKGSGCILQQTKTNYAKCKLDLKMIEKLIKKKLFVQLSDEERDEMATLKDYWPVPKSSNNIK